MNTTQTTGRFQRALDAACDRMAAIQNYLYWNAAQMPEAVLSEGRFCEHGAYCLIAALPNGYVRSTPKNTYAVMPYWTVDTRDHEKLRAWK